VRFETPSWSSAADRFGARLVHIAGERLKPFTFMATLGYLRRQHVRALPREAESLLIGLQSAFTTFGGVPEGS